MRREQEMNDHFYHGPRHVHSWQRGRSVRGNANQSTDPGAGLVGESRRRLVPQLSTALSEQRRKVKSNWELLTTVWQTIYGSTV